MYKVFINDKPIILTNTLVKTVNFLHFSYEANTLEDITNKLKFEGLEGLVLICENLDQCWQDFQNHFIKVVAAGGLVINEKKEFLFIYRTNKWDLPKGRIEKGENIEETAVREVKEECGLTKIELKEFLVTTYHLFIQDSKQKLKETHWYLMHANSGQVLVPQIEEGITKVVFKNNAHSKKALQNSYANISLVFESYNLKITS